MGLLTDPRQAALVLSSGGMFVKDFPADPGTAWPVGTSYIVFYASDGGVIATVAGAVHNNRITYNCAPNQVDVVPAGAGFELFLVTEDGPYKLRYGRVIRKEVMFSPTQTTVFHAVQFADNFQRSALGTKWIPVDGRTMIHNNTGLFGLGDEPNGVGQNFGALFQRSAIRYYAPLTGLSARAACTVLYPPLTVSVGRTAMMICADQLLTSYIALVFDTSIDFTHDHVKIVYGTGSPYDWTTMESAAVSIGTYDRYWVYYDDMSKTTSVYRADSTSPMLSWTDSTGIVPHGPGYTYLGFSWQANLLTTGPQITDWIAQDDVGPGIIPGS